MFVADADVKPFPDIVRSNSREHVRGLCRRQEQPGAIRAARLRGEEVCKDSDRPGRKTQEAGKRRSDAP